MQPGVYVAEAKALRPEFPAGILPAAFSLDSNQAVSSSHVVHATIIPIGKR